jgi:hypothetical protein
MEKLTLLSIPLTHTLTAAASTLDSSNDSIHVWRTAPLLVREDIHAEFLLTSLDEADVGEHALVLERAREFGGDGGAGVDSGEGDELEDEAILVSLGTYKRGKGEKGHTRASQGPR